VLVWLSVWSKVKIVCKWSSWCHCIPKPHHLWPHLNPDWFTFWYWLTQVVLEKRPLNRCSSSSSALDRWHWRSIPDSSSMLVSRMPNTKVKVSAIKSYSRKTETQVTNCSTWPADVVGNNNCCHSSMLCWPRRDLCSVRKALKETHSLHYRRTCAKNLPLQTAQYPGSH